MIGLLKEQDVPLSEWFCRPLNESRVEKCLKMMSTLEKVANEYTRFKGVAEDFCPS
jgi:hypothetical protein